MKQFIEKLIGFSIGPIVGAAISFITIPITTYFINPSEYGKASMFMLFQTILGTFLFLGLDQAYTREYHEQKNKKNLLQNAMLIPLILALSTFLITLLIPTLISKILFGNSNSYIPVVLFGIMTIFIVLERFIMLSIRMQERALEFSLLNIYVKLAVLMFTLIFVLFIRRDYLAVVYSSVFGQIIGDLYLIIRYRELLNIKSFKLDQELLKKMIIFGFPIVIAASLSSLLNSLDRLSLRAWSDFYQIGIFTAALKIASVITIIQTSFTSFWIPTAYRWYAEKKKIDYFKVVSDSVLLLMSTISIVILLFKDIIITILSSDYKDASPIIGFLCLQPIIYTVSETTCLGIVFSKKSYLNITISTISLIPNFIINLLLVPTFGAVGAAIATAVSFFVFFAGRTYFSSKNGFKFSVAKHYCVFLILLTCSAINLIETNWITFINIVFFILILTVQLPTFKTIYRIYNSSKIRG